METDYVPPRQARFAAPWARVADGVAVQLGRQATQHLLGDEVRLVREHRSSGERRCNLFNLPRDAPLKQFASAIKEW